MVNLNVDWGNPNVAGYVRHPKPTHAEPKSFLGGLFTLNGGEQEQQQKSRSSSAQYSSSSRPTPRRADTVTVLPAGVKMPTGTQPEISYGADGAKYLVIPPRRSNSSSRPRQIIVTHSPSPRRQNSTASASRSTPQRSNSSSQRPKSPPKPKLVGDPELVKQYEHSQRNVARWVEAVADTTSGHTRTTSKRTMTR